MQVAAKTPLRRPNGPGGGDRVWSIVFGNAIGNSVVDQSRPAPAAGSGLRVSARQAAEFGPQFASERDEYSSPSYSLFGGSGSAPRLDAGTAADSNPVRAAGPYGQSAFEQAFINSNQSAAGRSYDSPYEALADNSGGTQLVRRQMGTQADIRRSDNAIASAALAEKQANDRAAMVTAATLGGEFSVLSDGLPADIASGYSGPAGAVVRDPVEGAIGLAKSGYNNTFGGAAGLAVKGMGYLAASEVLMSGPVLDIDTRADALALMRAGHEGEQTVLAHANNAAQAAGMAFGDVSFALAGAAGLARGVGGLYSDWRAGNAASQALSVGSQGITKTPLGFQNTAAFESFGNNLHEGFEAAGYNSVQAAVQGSSVTGRAYRPPHDPFDYSRISDYDIAVSSPELFQRAKDVGIGLRQQGTRTGPLNPDHLERLGLTDVKAQLSQQAGRPVEFMIYRSIDDALARSQSIIVPRKPR